MSSDSIQKYLKEVQKHLSAGIATEHTYRPALKDLLESFADGVTATNEPKRVKCGAPDFIVTRGQTPLGNVEAKDVGKNLDEVEKSEQMERYREGLPNLILTDYLEFRWYQNGEFIESARLAHVGKNGKLQKTRNFEAMIKKVMEPFFSFTLPTVRSPRDLADRMAALARILRDVIARAFKDEDAKTGSLHAQYEAFKRVLLHDLETAPFADMYAQTICYGMFAACCNHDPARGAFTREAAAFDLPETNPFLREMFTYIAGPKLDSRLTWAVDHLTDLLHHADIAEILRDFGKRTRQEDPVVHFYETFLAAYDPKMREARGVYYTPEPVVSFIVRSVDKILKNDFKIKDGLASTEKVPLYQTVQSRAGKGKPRREKVGESHRVLILDPAVGTGTFLHGVVDQIHQQVQDSGMGGMWDSYVSEHLLPRLFGFELLMAPYAVAHMKLGIQLAETGYKFHSGERLRVYLTNTLEEAFELGDLPLFANLIAEEANAAGRVKTEAPVMVVLGNPPYSGHSENNSPFITDLLHGHDRTTGKATGNYFEVDGKPLKERNSKWLNDDYVKFIRFSQWRIDRTGHGILAFISNHGYLDNPTFRGMRQSLMETFDDIYIFDLHGNAKKKETAPDGSKDENVFDIMQGVTLGIFVKRKDPVKRKLATVTHAELWGQREIYEKQPDGSKNLVAGKYYDLYQNDLTTTKWETLKPQKPFHLFVPQDTELLPEYEAGWKVTEMMPVNGVGMTTARDGMVIDFESKPLVDRAKQFRNSTEPDEELCRQLDISMKKGWNIPRSRKMIQSEKERTLDQFVKPITYRPFDNRLIFYHDSIVWRTVKKIMCHMLDGKNMGLLWTRPMSPSYEFSVLTSNGVIDQCAVGNKSAGAGISYLGPLYLYPKPLSEAQDMVEAAEAMKETRERRPNLAPEFIEDISLRLKMRFIDDGKGTCTAGILPAENEKDAARMTKEDEREAAKMAAVQEKALQFSSPDSETFEIRSRGRLPHWTAEKATYFITYRLSDSLPKKVVEAYLDERQKIVANAESMERELSEFEKDRLEELYTKRISDYLDAGNGSCHLRNPEVAKVVADAFKHFDGKRYNLIAWCVMPNHVHLLFQVAESEKLADIVHSWKSYTANKANKILNRKGEFWHREYYDHLIRDGQDYVNHHEYIMNNPKKAKLKNWEWMESSIAGILPAGSENNKDNVGGMTKDSEINAAKMAAVLSFGPEDVFHYMYAVFHSPTYRERYAGFLKIDFPRLPLTSQLPLFRKLCVHGERLKDLHLMEADIKVITTFPITGDHTVEKPHYDEKLKRVYINKTQYFGGVPSRAWEFQVGGYQVCHKWLKDRKGRQLSYDDLTYYRHIVASLDETIDLMAKIDKAINKHGGWPIQ